MVHVLAVQKNMEMVAKPLFGKKEVGELRL
jgi:hypothetical protein